MAKPPHYIRDWRKHRRLTLEKLAEQLGMTHQNLGKIERFKVPYNQALLTALSRILGVPDWALIGWHPDRYPGIFEDYENLPEAERTRVEAVMKALISA